MSGVSWVWLEAVVEMCYVKNVFLEILQNSQENTCARVSFVIKLQACLHGFVFQNLDLQT